MAAVPVTNAWPTGKSSIPIPQFRPSNCSCLYFSVTAKSSSSSSSSNLRILAKSPIVVVSNHHYHHRRDLKLLCRCTTANDDASTSTTTTAAAAGSLTTADWDWNRWNRHFTEVEQAERCVSLLKFQLEEAIENEDFEEAKKLKIAIGESTLMDSVAEIMSELKNAVDEERYHDASKLCRNTASGLVGWWVGYSKDSDDPFGRIVRITPGVGRFIGRSYNPRQLVSASSGTPLFEIFVVKDTDANYTMQVVFLQRGKMSIPKPASPISLRSPKAPSAAAVENASVIDVQLGEDNVQNDEASTETEDSIIDEIRGVTKFLKDKLPELKLENFKIMKVNSFEDITEDVKQLIEDYDESDSEDEKSDVDESQPDQIPQEEDNDTIKEGKDRDVKLFLGGVLHNKDDVPPRDEYVRVPAEIEEMERDSFMLHVPARSRDQSTEASIASKVKIAAIAAQGISDLMPAAVAKALWNSDKISPKVSRNVREIVKLAINQAKKGEKLSEFTNFSRISTSRGELDPFDGLYIGAFGPYGTEVVQLRRKYGNWGMNDEFFEYVEAVKLTGDLNVPAGQVTFRAKVAKGNRFSSRGKYPEEFGVVASHSGQGRIADFGFKNPKWVSGELLLLNGKGMGPYAKGADLGFLYLIPDQSFLVLFNRLKLPE